jgi:hypothetical protein
MQRDYPQVPAAASIPGAGEGVARAYAIAVAQCGNSEQSNITVGDLIAPDGQITFVGDWVADWGLILSNGGVNHVRQNIGPGRWKRNLHPRA